MTSPSHIKGFTLLEILVAFTILALVGSALLQLFQSGLKNLALTEEYTYATLLARSKLNELETSDNPFQIDINNEPDNKYQVEVKIEPYEDEALAPDPPLQPFLAKLTIQWGAESHPHRYMVSSLLLLPKEAIKP